MVFFKDIQYDRSYIWGSIKMSDILDAWITFKYNRNKSKAVEYSRELNQLELYMLERACGSLRCKINAGEVKKGQSLQIVWW